MKKENKRGKEEFDPSANDNFLKNLDRAFETVPEEIQKVDIEETEDIAWINIDEKKEKESMSKEAEEFRVNLSELEEEKQKTKGLIYVEEPKHAKGLQLIQEETASTQETLKTEQNQRIGSKKAEETEKINLKISSEKPNQKPDLGKSNGRLDLGKPNQKSNLGKSTERPDSEKPNQKPDLEKSNEKIDSKETDSERKEEIPNITNSELEDSFDTISFDFPELEPEIEPVNEDSILEDISNSLSSQTGNELEPKEKIKQEEKKEEVPTKQKLPKFVLPLSITAGVLVLVALFLFATKPGKQLLLRIVSNYIEDQVNYDDGSDHIIEEIEDDVDITDDELENNTEITIIPEENIKLETDTGSARHEDYAVNILLLGEEAIGSGSARGRTDLIMIATMNIKEKSYKLTSLMRDTLVEIPGQRENKLNAAYQIGGIPLLYETIEHNFDIKVDGYCMVGFDDFEAIIDRLGGVDITLTPAEANYLNKENYISNPVNRKMKAGVNHMNGNQALGYCRIRYVGTGKEANDFGRTSRHRIVLNAIFDQYKSLGYVDLIMLLNDCLTYITTDMRSDQISAYLEQALEIGLTDVENFRIPIDGGYEGGYVRKMSVLVPDLPKNVKALHEFIFGSEQSESKTGQNN